MSVPRLEIRLDRICQNARTLVDRLTPLGVGVTGVTKATLGSPEVARALLRGGVGALGESRIENIEALHRAGIRAPMTLIRSPMLSQAGRVVTHASTSLNTELEVIERLSVAAVERGKIHGIVLMVELGDLREGILPGALEAVARRTASLPNIELRGIGTNLACQNGVTPDERNMAELSALAASVESALGRRLEVVSGGNSANLGWVLGGGDLGRVNDLRVGESILLGCDVLDRRPIDGMRTDAFTLVGEVIESNTKPTQPWGALGQTAFGPRPPRPDRGPAARAIVALGRQDVDPDGIAPPAGRSIIGASSDHLVLETGTANLAVGSEVAFGLDYAALLRAMTSPFVERVYSLDGSPS